LHAIPVSVLSKSTRATNFPEKITLYITIVPRCYDVIDTIKFYNKIEHAIKYLICGIDNLHCNPVYECPAILESIG